MSRLLLVSYFFPPLGGIGVQRALRFARYLPEHGWSVTVLAPSNSSYALRDEGLLRPTEPFEVVRAAALELPDRPYRLRQALARRIVPDDRAGWIPAAVRVGTRAAQQCDAVLSIGPPMTSHYVGRTIATRAGLPWVADFRDPYADNAYDRSSASEPKRKRQIDVLNAADAVTVAWQGMREQFGRQTDTPITVVSNGYDPCDFDRAGAPRHDGVLRMVYVGSLYGDRRPDGLVAGIRLAIERNPAARANIRVRVVGAVDSSARALFEELGDVVELTGFVSREAALEEMMAADVLALIFPQGSGAEFVPGKLFEYWAARKHILALVEPGGAHQVMAEAGGATLVAPNDASAIAGFLLSRIGADAAALELPAKDVVERYSAPKLAGCLADVLEAVVERRSARG